MPVTRRLSHDHLTAQLGNQPPQAHRPRHLAEGPQLVPVIGLLGWVDDVEIDRRLLVVTAVRSDDEQPSVYLDIVDPPEESDDGDELRPFSEVPRPMTLGGLVAELRREVVVGATVSDRHTAAGQLARLAAARVVGADPSSWCALTPLSDDRPLRAEGVIVTVSPSRIESFRECSLRWLLSACGGDGPGVGAASIGTLIHDIAAELGDVDEATLQAEVEARWGRLGLPDGWLSRRQLAEAQSMVARLARYFEDSTAGGWECVGVELDMQVELGRALLKGRVDRLERHSDGGLLSLIHIS